MTQFRNPIPDQIAREILNSSSFRSAVIEFLAEVIVDRNSVGDSSCHSYRLRLTKLLRSPSEDGMFPLSWLPLMHRYCRLLRLPSHDGIFPLNWFEYSLRLLRLLRLASEAGDTPAELVGVQAQRLQVAEIAEFRRDTPAQCVGGQLERDHVARIAGLTAAAYAGCAPGGGGETCDRPSRALCRVMPYRPRPPADSRDRLTHTSLHWDPKRLPNTVLAWSRTKGTSCPFSTGGKT